MSAGRRGQIAAVAARKLAKVAGSRRGPRLREAHQVSRRRQAEGRDAAAPLVDASFETSAESLKLFVVFFNVVNRLQDSCDKDSFHSLNDSSSFLFFFYLF